MGKYLQSDIGIVCLVFWSIMAALLAWYILRVVNFQIKQNTNLLEKEECENEVLLLEPTHETESNTPSNEHKETRLDYTAH